MVRGGDCVNSANIDSLLLLLLAIFCLFSIALREEGESDTKVLALGPNKATFVFRC